MDIQQQVADFFGRYPERTFHKGELIARAEEAPSGVFYIVEGRVSQYDITPTGNEVVVNVFKPGAFFPMSWAMNNTPNHYFFEASTQAVIREAPAADAVQFLRENPAVTYDLLARVYRGVDGVLRRMAHLMGGDAKSRLLFELINAAQRFGEAQPNGDLLVPIKESDFGRHSGLARETVNRTMQQLKAKGLISVSRGGTVVHDLHGVEELLGQAL
ncbi:MAG TPA: Crp/Fnr family transcriptional regulator [Candidatus Saccharimonadales bacterium]|nr:Crp/Fnr family transcriptional regulator [Candidatus Saccharimonadales bacterium]